MTQKDILADTVIATNRGWFFALGSLMIILGGVAIVFPLATAIAAKTLFGWLLLIGGAVQVFHAFSTKGWSAFFFNLLVGIVYVLVGGWLAFLPLTGILTLTILLASAFVAQGILEALMAFRLRPMEGWVWILAAGVLALAVGLMILAQLPGSAVWVIGLLVGINMLSSGWAYVFLAMVAKK